MKAGTKVVGDWMMLKIDLINELLDLTKYMLKKHDYSKDTKVTKSLKHIIAMVGDDKEYRDKLEKVNFNWEVSKSTEEMGNRT